MDKIKTVKIKNPDGSVSEETYTISVDAKNVDMANGKELQDTIGTIDIDTDGNIAEQLKNLKNDKVNKTDIIDNLNSVESNKVLSANQGKVLGDAVAALDTDIKKKAYFFDTVADMKAANLHEGDYVCTLGYYSANDGGGAEYKIVSAASQTDHQEQLNNNLYATIIINNEINVKQLGAIADGETDTRNNFIKLFSLNTNKIVIPFGNYYMSDKITLSNIENKIVENYGQLKFESTDTVGSACFELRECKNITFIGFNISSMRNKESHAPSGHTRITEYSSNRIGFHILKCEEIRIMNSTFNNLEYDVKITKRTADPEATILNKNIKIDGVYSRNSSQPVYAQDIDGLFINNCDIITAEDLGDGDHILYVGEYSKNIHYYNSIVKAGNKYFGVLFNLQDSLYNTDAAAPVDFHADNIICSGLSLVGAKNTTKCYLNNIKFEMIDLETNPNQTVLGLTGNCYVEVNNSKLKTTKQMYQHYSGTPKVVIKNSELVGTGNAYLFGIATAGTGDVLVKDSTIKNTFAVMNIAAQISNALMIFDNCIFDVAYTYTFSSRNPSGNNKVRLRNCYFKNTYTGTTSLSFNGGTNDMTGYEVLSCYMNGYTQFSAYPENAIVLNSYLNNVIIN